MYTCIYWYIKLPQVTVKHFEIGLSCNLQPTSFHFWAFCHAPVGWTNVHILVSGCCWDGRQLGTRNGWSMLILSVLRAVLLKQEEYEIDPRWSISIDVDQLTDFFVTLRLLAVRWRRIIICYREAGFLRLHSRSTYNDLTAPTGERMLTNHTGNQCRVFVLTRGSAGDVIATR